MIPGGCGCSAIVRGRAAKGGACQYGEASQAKPARYLDTLERKGLIVRNKHKSDRRAHAISITDKARELIRVVQPATLDRANQLIEGIDQRELDTFVDVLARLKANAEHIVGGN